MRFGRFQIDIFSDGTFKIDGGAMFGVVPKVLWNAQKESDDLNRVTMDMNCVLIRDADHVVLVETGAGSKLTDKQRNIYGIERPPQLLHELAAQDLFPLDTLEAKRTILPRAVEERWIVGFTHDLPRFGTVSSVDGKYHFTEAAD